MNINILGRTGPRSIKGKAISSRNALKHGAYSKTEVLPHEDASERKRLERELYKALKPNDAVEENLVDQMVACLWICERFKLRLSMKQEPVFARLLPRGLAQLVGVPEIYEPFAPDYLKEPNTKFPKKDLKLPEERYQLYLHLMDNAKGIQNYQLVFVKYKKLFEGLHDFLEGQYSVDIIMSTGAGLEIAWQNNPEKLEELLLEYAASLYYMIHFDELRPQLRVAIASWFFVQRADKRESDFQDDLVNKELNRYRTLLDTLMKYRKNQIEAKYLLSRQEKSEAPTNQ